MGLGIRIRVIFRLVLPVLVGRDVDNYEVWADLLGLFQLQQREFEEHLLLC